MSSPKQPKIAILGGGPAGLTLASLLTKNNIPFTVFELRSCPFPSDIDVPSGSLDLHAESGLLALQACALSEQFKELSGECSEDFIVADKYGSIKAHSPGYGNRPEISRNALAFLLLSTIRPEDIKWEQKVRSVTPSTSTNGKWKLSFADGGKADEEFDLVIGADGAWSKARPAVTEVKPHASRINTITLTITHITSSYPHLAKRVGEGTYSACGQGKALLSQRGSLDLARIYLMIQTPPSSNPENWLGDSRLDSMTALELKHELLTSPSFYQSWADDLKELISISCDAEHKAGTEISVKTMYMLPHDHSWTHVRGVTLIGDAAHLSGPNGEGVNQAMLDALELSQAIIKSYPSSADSNLDATLDLAVEEYEKAMFPRVKPISEDGAMLMDMFFADDAPKPLADFFKSHEQPPEAE
jgi:2-polyprenyl-6-methoxyphenol hydroxylase-like FAD-dependent oxidoreductase